MLGMKVEEYTKRRTADEVIGAKDRRACGYRQG